MMNIQRLDKNGNSSTDLGPIFVYDRYGRLKKIGGTGSGGTGTAGPQGNQGPTGPPGPSNGIVGPPGPDGIAGPQGYQGAQGDQGLQGERGLKGDKGDKGSTGNQGNQGNQGTGTQGPEGIRGPQGPQGCQGDRGPRGFQGDDGFQGVQGDQGIDGTIGVDGAQGDQGDQGPQGPPINIGNIITTDPNTGINLSSVDESRIINTIYNTALDPALAMPAAVGGIPATTTVANLSNKNFVQIFNDILFPTQNPTYTIPTITLASTVTSIREIGQTFSPTVTLVGTKNDAGAFSQLTVRKSINGGSASTLTTGSITITSATAIAPQFTYPDPNNPNFSYTVSTTDSGLIIPAPASGGTNSTVTYSGLGNYDAGLAKKNNKGSTDVRPLLVRNSAAPQSADTNFAPSAQTITGYYPYFYGKTSTQKTAAEIVTIIQAAVAGTYTKVTNNAAGSLSMTFGATGEWPWFATYSVYTTKTGWVDQSQPLNNGAIGNPTDLFPAPTTVPNVASADGYWTTSFKIYPAGKVTTLGTATIS
jgi:hypothetical protein